MPRICSICTHPEHEAINTALVKPDPLRTIADRWSVSKTALIRHKADHLPATLTKAHEAHEVAQADHLLAELDRLKAEAHRLKNKAEESGDYKTALVAVRELVRIVELLAKLHGELKVGTQVNILVLPQWQRVRTALLAALAPYPEARLAVAAALAALDDGHELRP